MNGSEVGALSGLSAAQCLDSEDTGLVSAARKLVRRELAVKRVDKALWAQARAAHGEDREATREAYIESRARWLLARSEEPGKPGSDTLALRLIGDPCVETRLSVADSGSVELTPDQESEHRPPLPAETLVLAMSVRPAAEPRLPEPLAAGQGRSGMPSAPAAPARDSSPRPLIERLQGLMQDPSVRAAPRPVPKRRSEDPLPRALSPRLGLQGTGMARLKLATVPEHLAADAPAVSPQPESDSSWWPVILAAGGALVLGICAVMLTVHYRQTAPAWSEALEGELALQQGDNERGLALWSKLAEEGDPVAQLRLGTLYQDGRGVAQDPALAAQWYERSAKQDNPDAQFLLAEMYESGLGVTQDAGRAAFWYGRAAERFRKAAERGDASAQLSLAGMYESGNGVPQSYKEALRWYQGAADQGDASAQLQCGWMYSEGLGTAPNAAKAALWYRKAAEQGNAEAQVRLGYLYETGRGVQESRVESERWYQAAASQPGFDARAILEDLGKR